MQEAIMFATNVRNLKKNPSLALRKAEQEPVLVLKGDQPNALIIHLDGSNMGNEQLFRPAVAASLYKDQTLSLGAAARLSGLTLAQFIEHLSSLDLDIVQVNATTEQEAEDIGAWLAS